MSLLIRYGETGLVPSRSTLVALVDGKAVGSAAKLPDDSERWLVIGANVPAKLVHEDDYTIVASEPAARAALEALAEQGGAA